MIKFEWDPKKGAKNQQKHGVSFQEAQSVFYDEDALQFFDGEHFEQEDRFLMLGLSNNTRVLMVCHCEKKDGDIIRIISARKATKNERNYYAGENRYKGGNR